MLFFAIEVVFRTMIQKLVDSQGLVHSLLYRRLESHAFHKTFVEGFIIAQGLKFQVRDLVCSQM